jgi:hypothetical protein
VGRLSGRYPARRFGYANGMSEQPKVPDEEHGNEIPEPETPTGSGEDDEEREPSPSPGRSIGGGTLR